MKIKSLALKVLPLAALGWLIALPARAICPVCVIAVGAGLGLSEYLGIDDAVAGLWVGGLIVAMIIWTINWFNTKGWKFGNKDWRDVLTVIIYYAAVIWPLAIKKFIGRPGNTLWGLDKLSLGIVIGSLVFLAGTMWYNNIKKRRGHAHFPYEKVVMPVGALLIFSGIFYFITR